MQTLKKAITKQEFNALLTRMVVPLASSLARDSGQTICFACEAWRWRMGRGAGEGARAAELFREGVILRPRLSKVNNS